MAHLFFAWRIYVLSSSKILAGVIAFFGIVSIGKLVAVRVKMAVLSYTNDRRRYPRLLLVHGAQVCDSNRATSLARCRLARIQRVWRHCHHSLLDIPVPEGMQNGIDV
jgi:hypothetical protein